MPELVARSVANPEFPRVVEVAKLSVTAPFTFDILPDEFERAALARLLDAQTVRKLRFAGSLMPIAEGGWLLDAALGATVVQTCVVSLEPVITRIDQPVRRRFVPTKPMAEVEISPVDDDEIEPLGPRIDLGLVAIEALALALPDYPRSEGAELQARSFAAEGVRPLEDSDLKPFSALAALRDKLGNGS
jgi:uncharacterized metal-binding protein YceD (DUF177 family)